MAPVKLAPGSKGLIQNRQLHSATVIKNLMMQSYLRSEGRQPTQNQLRDVAHDNNYSLKQHSKIKSNITIPNRFKKSMADMHDSKESIKNMCASTNQIEACQGISTIL